MRSRYSAYVKNEWRCAAVLLERPPCCVLVATSRSALHCWPALSGQFVPLSTEACAVTAVDNCMPAALRSSATLANNARPSAPLQVCVGHNAPRQPAGKRPTVAKGWACRPGCLASEACFAPCIFEPVLARALSPSQSSTHPSSCRPTADDIQATCDSLGFEKLKILSVEQGKDENEGYVTFQVG